LQWVPGTSVPHLTDREHRAPGPRYSDPLRLPKARLGGVRFSPSSPAPSPPPIPCIARLSLCSFSYKARVRGWSLLSTPGVFTVPVGTPTPDVPQGDRWLSHVPESPLCLHAPLSDPGGV